MASAVTALGSQCVEVKSCSEVHVHSVKNPLKQTSLQYSTPRTLRDLRSFGSDSGGLIRSRLPPILQNAFPCLGGADEFFQPGRRTQLGKPVTSLEFARCPCTIRGKRWR